MLSEIQHYAFCPRQWALIHLEQHWQENVLTVEGNALHEKAHDENIKEKRGKKIIVVCAWHPPNWESAALAMSSSSTPILQGYRFHPTMGDTLLFRLSTSGESRRRAMRTFSN